MDVSYQTATSTPAVAAPGWGPLEGGSGVGLVAAVIVLAVVGIAAAKWSTRRGGRPVSPPRSPEDQIQALIDANRYEDAGDFRLKQGEFRKALALYLNSGNVSKAGLCYLSLKEPKKAAELYLGAGRLAEAAHYFQTAGAWKEAAECLNRLGSEREAAELYERAGQLATAAHILRGLGDAENAARLFERAGLGAEAAAALLAAHGKTDVTVLRRAAGLFEATGERRRAAECFAGAGEWRRAAELFEELSELGLAAQAYEHAGDHGRAAGTYERAGALREARTNYERAGDRAKAAEISIQIGNLLDAGRTFYEIGSVDRAIETLNRIAADAPQHREATLVLGRIFLEKGLFERARVKLESLVVEPPRSKEDLDVLSLLGDVYERAGDPLRALGVLERVAEADPAWPDIEQRLEHLQERAWGGSTTSSTHSHSPHNERYQLRDEIGRGGMGVVHLAQDRELERPVAIKFLPPELASRADALQMFRQEARAAAAMNHPNIVHVYDVTVVGGRPCIVMEYVQGNTVRELMRRSGREKQPLAVRRVAEIARDICEALAYAHHQNVIHRDVKPGNIIVSDRGTAKLMDFGISKVLEVGGAGLTQARGTPQYMPPEQILGREVDGRSDLYALGISIFEAVTGRRPFRGEDVVHQHLNVELPDPRSLRPDCPDALVEVIRRACQKRSADRFRGAREMADALSDFLDLP